MFVFHNTTGDGMFRGITAPSIGCVISTDTARSRSEIIETGELDGKDLADVGWSNINDTNAKLMCRAKRLSVGRYTAL